MAVRQPAATGSPRARTPALSDRRMSGHGGAAAAGTPPPRFVVGTPPPPPPPNLLPPSPTWAACRGPNDQTRGKRSSDAAYTLSEPRTLDGTPPRSATELAEDAHNDNARLPIAVRESPPRAHTPYPPPTHPPSPTAARARCVENVRARKVVADGGTPPAGGRGGGERVQHGGAARRRRVPPASLTPCGRGRCQTARQRPWSCTQTRVQRAAVG